MNICPIGTEYREKVNEILKREWSCPPSISRGRALDTTKLPGFVCVENDEIQGIVTFNITDAECEIVTLNSFWENRGIGSALIAKVIEVAREAECKRVWLITTNDDIGAIRFYQKRNMDMVALHRNAIELSRKLKPSIPLIGVDGIPIKHEIEFEILL